MGSGQRDPHGRPRVLIISHTDCCLQPEPQLARCARKVPGAPTEPPIAGSQPRAHSLHPLETFLVRLSLAPSLPASLNPSLRLLPGLRSAATSCRVLGNCARFGYPRSSVLGVGRGWDHGTASRGREWPAAPVAAESDFQTRARFAAPPGQPRVPSASRAGEPAGRPPHGECPRVCPSPFARALSVALFGVPQASLLWDEDLVQGSLGRIRRRLERGKVVKGSHFLSPPRKPKQQRLEVVSPSLKSGQLSTFPPLHSP